MADELRGDLSEADVAAVVRNNPGAVVDAIRNQAIEPSEVESDSSSAGVSDVGELSVSDVEAIYAYNTNGNLIEPFQIADYIDGGTALQAAMDSLPSRGGRIVLPPADLQVNSTLNTPTGEDHTIIVEGHGAGKHGQTAGTRLVSNITDGSDILSVGTGSGTGSATGTFLRDLTISGTGSDGRGIHGRYWNLIGGLSNVAINGVGGAGIRVENSWGLSMVSPRIYGVGKRGIVIGTAGNSVSLRDYYVQNAGGDGISVIGGAGVCLSGGVSEKSAGADYRVGGAEGVSFHGCYAEGQGADGATSHGWIIASGSAQIYSGQATNHSNNGILCNGGKTIIDGLHFNEPSGVRDIQLAKGTATVRSPDHGDSNGTPLTLSGGSDHNLEYSVPPSISGSGASRPRWFGVIGGGPLGGVDTGTVTGQYVGDSAIADGTTNTAGKKYRWDGSTWNLIA